MFTALVKWSWGNLSTIPVCATTARYHVSLDSPPEFPQDTPRTVVQVT